MRAPPLPTLVLMLVLAASLPFRPAAWAPPQACFQGPTQVHLNSLRARSAPRGPLRPPSGRRGACDAPRMGLFDFLQPKAWSEEQQEALTGSLEDQAGVPEGVPALLQGTYMQGRQLTLAYKASQSGWSAADFHSACDFKGPCVVLGTTQDGYRFGAFNPIGWQSDDDYKSSTQAFLFFYPSQGGAPVKLEKVGGGEAALFDYARSGPHFGADGLVIGASQQSVMGLFAGPDPTDLTTGQGQLQSAASVLGQSYAKIPSEYGQTGLFGGDASVARLAEIEVYFSEELAGMF